MGLDAVEICLRAEDLYGITLEDNEAAAVRTVGEFYKLICSKLRVIPLEHPVTSTDLPVITHKERTFLFLEKRTPLPAPAEVLPWSPQTVWDALVAIFVDQMSLDPEEILYNATIAEDLRID